MKAIDTWSTVQMKSFIIKAMWYDGELQELDLADLLLAVKHTHRSKDWIRTFSSAYKQVLDTYFEENV